MKLLSTEAEGVSEAIPEESRPRLVNAAGRVGALLGLQAPPVPPAADGDGAATSAASASAPQPVSNPGRKSVDQVNGRRRTKCAQTLSSCEGPHAWALMSVRSRTSLP